MTHVFATLVILALSNLPVPFYPLWESRYAYGADQTTLLFVAYQGGVLLTLVIVHLSRPAKNIGLMRFATVIAIGACVVFQLANSETLLILGRTLSGIAVGIVISCGAAAIQRSRARLGKRDGALLAASTYSIGLTSGPLLGGFWLASAALTPDAVFIVIAGTATVALIWLMASREPLLPPRASPPDARVHPSKRLPIPIVLGSVAYCSSAAMAGIIVGLGATVLADILRAPNPLVSGTLVAMFFGSSFVAQLSLRAIGSGRQITVAAIAMITASLLVVLACATRHAIPFLIAALISGAAQGTAQLGTMDLIRKVALEHRLSGAYAAMNSVVYTTTAVSALLIGLGTTWSGLQQSLFVAGWIIAGGAAALTLILLLTANKLAPE